MWQTGANKVLPVLAFSATSWRPASPRRRIEAAGNGVDRQASGTMAHELGAFDIRVKLVEPGYGPTTRFAENGAERMNGLIPDTYADFARPIFEAFARPQATTQPEDVAKAVWHAVHDTSDQFHFPAGADAVALAGPQ